MHEPLHTMNDEHKRYVLKIMIDIINDVPFVTLNSKVLMILLSTLHSFNVTINDLTFFSKCAGIETHVAMLLFARYPFDHLL